MKRLSFLIISNIVILILIQLLWLIPFLDFGINILCFIVLGLNSWLIYNYFAVHYYLIQFPLNKLENYRFIVKKYYLTEDKELIFKMEKKGSTYTVFEGENKLIFEMKYCIFPKFIILAYFVRQFQIFIINTRKLDCTKIGNKLRINCLSENLKNVYLIYKNRKYYIVKNYKTHTTFAIQYYNAFYYSPVISRNRGNNFIKVSENDFEKDKPIYPHYSPYKHNKLLKQAEKNRRRNSKLKKQKKLLEKENKKIKKNAESTDDFDDK